MTIEESMSLLMTGKALVHRYHANLYMTYRDGVGFRYSDGTIVSLSNVNWIDWVKFGRTYQ